MPYYGVAVGRNPGVYFDWYSCKVNFYKYPGASYRKFSTFKDAQEFADSTLPSTSFFSSYFGGGHEQIYVDGACRGNGQAGIPKLGFGVYFGPGDERNVSVALFKFDDVVNIKPTNQRVELHALRYALWYIRRDIRKNRGLKLYEILTDSAYSKNAVDTWSYKWSQNC